MRPIGLLDPSIASENVGDEIIMDAVVRELRGVARLSFFFRAPTQEYLGRSACRTLAGCAAVIVGGTNLLASNMHGYKQWKVNWLDLVRLPPVTLMGVGWWQYQDDPDRYTRILLRGLLAHDGLHAVRDRYTAAKLHAIGIDNVVVTGCPTLWRLTPEHCAAIPRQRGRDCVITVTSYKPDAGRDRQLLGAVRAAYRKVHLWLQGGGDLDYARAAFGRELDGVALVGPALTEFDALLAGNPDLDYVGTRLHAGLRALQRQRRTLIIGVDNRAEEMGKDFCLPVLARAAIDELPARIESTAPLAIQVPGEAIERWLAQWRGRFEG